MEADSVGVQACIHHWILGEPAKIIPGTCKYCGETREFSGDMWDANSEGGAMRQIIHDSAVKAMQRPKTVDGDA